MCISGSDLCFVFLASEPEMGKPAKKKAGDKKMQGFDRGLAPEKIIGATDSSGKRI